MLRRTNFLAKHCGGVNRSSFFTKTYSRDRLFSVDQKSSLNFLNLSQSKIPRRVRVVEVGPRDGLQNEGNFVPTAVKIDLINRLSQSGLPVIEATSFVRADRIPQLQDCEEVMRGIQKKAGVSYPVLTPNMNGFKKAIAAGAKEVAIFGSASNSFSLKNINATTDESLQRFSAVTQSAAELGIKVRGYVSCVCGCPYEGPVKPEVVADVAKKMIELGCYEISLGDTIGVGTPGSVHAMLQAVMNVIPPEKLAVHFHNTYGQALSNVLVALQMGIATVDSSIAGLGGCPYANGATGNVATEEVIYMLHGMGIETNVDLDSLVETSHFISTTLGKPNRSNVTTALISKKLKSSSS